MWRLKSSLRRLRTVMQPMRERGLGLVAVLLVHVPVAFMWRGWRVLAQPLNGGLIQRVFNQPRFIKFQDTLAHSALPRFYVIVMPLTLHFLLPCLALLQGHAQVVLLSNGARRWERRVLTERFPNWPMFELWTLPLSSVAHGHVISLLLTHHRDNFGIIDHDCYVFDDTIFRQLAPASDECVVSLFSETSRSVGTTFPLTFFMFFNAEALRLLMQRYAVDARLYRKTPAEAVDAMARIGLGPTTFWKDYHDFRDTLHVLLAVAMADGLKFRFLTSDEERPAMHVGGTSIGTHHTKALQTHYIHLRFLELLNDPLLNRRYAFLSAPLKQSTDALVNADLNDPSWQWLPAFDTLMQRLQQPAPTPAPRGRGSHTNT